MVLPAVFAVVLAALTQSDAPAPLQPHIDARAACHLAHAERIPPGRVYSIAGTYEADGMHGSELEIPDCDIILIPAIDGDAAARIGAYHQAWRVKCHSTLMGDWMKGVFTGAFVRERAQLYGMQAPMMVEFFVITGLQTPNEDPASIACPKPQ
jgi:hypothetical protein